MAFSTGWASGLNSYLVVLVLGISDRIHNFTQIPDVLHRWDVLGAAGLLYAMDFVADKIPYIDSTWDAINTAIRPTVGAVIGVLLAGHATSLDQAINGVTGGTAALGAHITKAGSRLAINASPEPFTNIGASLGEDAAVLGVVGLAINHPYIAATIAGILLVLGLILVIYLFRVVRRGWRKWKKKEPFAKHPQPA